MKAFEAIVREHSSGNIRFHKRFESDMFSDSLRLYSEKRFASCASLCSVLYERIFATRYINQIANPAGFVPTKENINEQFANLLKAEEKVENDDRMPFRKITQGLVDEGVIQDNEKSDYDDFYTNVRNPVMHGLITRLFKDYEGRNPSSTFEVDASYEQILEKVSLELINKIYEVMAIKELRKK